VQTSTSRLDRLRRLQARLHTHSGEKKHWLHTQSGEMKHSEIVKPLAAPERISGSGTKTERLNGARQRASKSLRRNVVGSLIKRCSPPNSPRPIPVSEEKPRKPAAPPMHGLVEVYLQTSKATKLPPQDHAYPPSHQDAKSFASGSSRRSKDLIHALPLVAKARNAAAAKPGR